MSEISLFFVLDSKIQFFSRKFQSKQDLLLMPSFKINTSIKSRLLEFIYLVTKRCFPPDFVIFRRMRNLKNDKNLKSMNCVG